MQKTSFQQTQTILRALEFALARGGFGGDASQKKTAATLVKDMKGAKSVSGRHQLLTSLLKKGSTIEEMMKTTAASRRTIFRYLNSLEEAGVDIVLADGKYRMK